MNIELISLSYSNALLHISNFIPLNYLLVSLRASKWIRSVHKEYNYTLFIFEDCFCQFCIEPATYILHRTSILICKWQTTITIVVGNGKVLQYNFQKGLGIHHGTLII